jgi:hypothetical protein
MSLMNPNGHGLTKEEVESLLEPSSPGGRRQGHEHSGPQAPQPLDRQGGQQVSLAGAE